MSIKSEILEKIELYSRGRMSAEERASFENEMLADEILQRQVEISSVIDEMVIAEEALKLKKQMQKDLKKPGSKAGFYIVGAVVLSGLIGAGLYFSKNKDVIKPGVPIVSETKVKIAAEVKVRDKPVVPATSGMEDKKISERTEVKNTAGKQPLVESSGLSELSEKKKEPEPFKTQTEQVTETKNELKPEVIKADPCAGLTGYVTLRTVPSCKDEETGEAHINPETVKGGKTPFTFSLSDKKSSGSFTHLAAGTYSVTVTDANNCIVESPATLTVSEKKCPKHRQYTFNPGHDLIWTIPFDGDKNPSAFKILDKSGKLFYQSSISGGEPSNWGGESNTGSGPGIGLYFFVIEYADGSVDEGSVTITR